MLGGANTCKTMVKPTDKEFVYKNWTEHRFKRNPQGEFETVSHNKNALITLPFQRYLNDMTPCVTLRARLRGISKDLIVDVGVSHFCQMILHLTT